ncbi:MAG: phospholipase D family protein [Syntrophus sp. (in: bacteria)]|nr:phospholipase D family protein [Syntrophus sp. (in: bacteria)]
MKTTRCFVQYILVCALCLFPVMLHSMDITFKNTPSKVFFSPDGGCTTGIIEETVRAQKEILVQIFSFTSGPIRNALIKAQKRGVAVAVILDPREQKNHRYKTADILSRAGVQVYLDDQHSHAHNKVMVIDRDTVVTGSFNYTYGAESKNAENIIIIRSHDLAKAYVDDWLKHKEHSRRH